MNKEQIEGLLLTPPPETCSGDVRRNSTGNVATRASSSQSNSEGKILPHYLTTSTGSCHDFCKYGRKHTFESKGRNPHFPRHSGTRTSSEKGQKQMKIPSLAEKQKKSSVKLKAAAPSEIGLYDGPKISKEKASSQPEINKQSTLCHERCGSPEESEIKCNLPSPSKEIEPAEGFGTIKQGAFEKIRLCHDTETAAQKNSAILKKTSTSRDSEITKKKKPSAKKILLSLEPASAVQRTQSAKKSFASAKPKIEQKVPSHVKKAISQGKPKASEQVTPSPVNRLDASARPALSGKSSIKFLRSEYQPKPATGIAGRNVGSKIANNVDLSKQGGKKNLKSPLDSLSHQPVDPSKRGRKITLKSPLDSLSPQPSVNHVSKSASAVKHVKKVENAKLKNDKIREKTLYIIGSGATDNENTKPAQSKSSSRQPSPSSPSSSSSLSSSPLSSSSVSDHEEEEHLDSESAFSEACDLVSDHGGDGTNIAAQNEGKKSKGKVAIAPSEYKDQTPYKLKFRRGKILNPQSDHGVTGRLRFRQGRSMSDSQSDKGEMGKISFKMKESTSGDSSHPDPEAQGLVLRHQDVQDKKDTVGLFNHVIEETASKLAETRKSKVKALVGAFETVISLQESKPATSV